MGDGSVEKETTINADKKGHTIFILTNCSVMKVSTVLAAVANSGNGSGCERKWQQRKELRITPPPYINSYAYVDRFKLLEVEFCSHHFLATPPDHGVRRCVAATAHLKMEPCPNTLEASPQVCWNNAHVLFSICL